MTSFFTLVAVKKHHWKIAVYNFRTETLPDMQLQENDKPWGGNRYGNSAFCQSASHHSITDYFPKTAQPKVFHSVVVDHFITDVHLP